MHTPYPSIRGKPRFSRLEHTRTTVSCTLPVYGAISLEPSNRNLTSIQNLSHSQLVRVLSALRRSVSGASLELRPQCTHELGLHRRAVVHAAVVAVVVVRDLCRGVGGTFSPQQKLKPGEALAAKPATIAATKPLVQRDTNEAAPATRRAGLAACTDVKKAGDHKPGMKVKPTLPSGTPRRTATGAASFSLWRCHA